MKKIKRLITFFTAVSLLFSVTGCTLADKIKEIAMPQDTHNAAVENNTEQEVSNSISVGVIDFDTFNPLVTKSETVKEAMQMVYEPLFDVNESLQPVPILAESYTVSPDGRTIDITLRQGVQWHDGDAFTAYDVAYTIKQIRSGITEYTDILTNLADYKATGDNTIELVLNYAVPNFVSLLTFPIVKYKSDMSVNPNTIPVGTGAFGFNQQLSTGKIEFKAFDNYHGGRAQIDMLYVYTAPTLEKYESMFEASEIDLMTGETVDLSTYTPRGSAKNNEYITNKMTFVGYNLQNELLWGANTRKGLSKLIDKDSIVNSTLYSRGVASDLPINPSSIFYYDTNARFKNDEILALEFLKNDGWSVGEDGKYQRKINGVTQKLTLDILTNIDSAEKVSIANSIANGFMDFGIPATVTAVPYEEYTAKINSKKFDVMIGEIEVSANLDLTPLVSSADNYFSYRNTDLDMLIGQMGMTHDMEQLKTLFCQYGDTIMNDMPFSVLFFRKGDVLSSSKIKTEVVPSISQEYRNIESWSVK